jgi:adenine-specific DNA-methyltransferase
VKLYWANYEQYYTKTGLLFRDYTFKADSIKAIFRVVSAREEVGSKKATKERFFVLDDENPVELTQDNCIIGWDDHPTRDDCVNNHVLFLEDANWPEELFRLINF